MKKTILFLDIDGVFSIPSKEKAKEYIKFGYGLFAYPIPIAYYLIRCIANDKRLHPVWLSAWDTGATIWNDKAEIKHFPVAYHLTSRQASYASRVLPHLDYDKVDHKLIAVQYYLHRFPSYNVVWLEDGFADETVQWASDNGHRFVDTTEEAIRAMLVKEYDDYDETAMDFVENIVL